MRLETFRARDLSSVARNAEALFGDDAIVLQTRTLRDNGDTVVEVIAAAAADVDAFRDVLTPAHLPLPTARPNGRPYIIAVVGPTGAGKTTTIAKLASNVQAFATWSVGMITLDTYRVAGLEQIATYAEITGCPLDVAYDADDAMRAVESLASCDVLLVDTPGRSLKSGARGEEWWPLLRAIRPDEIHLVVPAGLRTDIARHVCHAHRELMPTHLLLSKLDDVPDDTGIAELAAQIALPTRWLTDGLDVPADLKPAPQRILAALGLMAAQVAS